MSFEKISYVTDPVHDPNTHYFRLASRNSVEDIVADFTPVNSFTPTNNLRSYSILPTFNLDRKSFTDAFINPHEGLEPL